MPVAQTLTNLVASVRVDLVEPTEGFWLDVDIKRWLNDGYADLCIAAKVDAGPVILPTVVSQEAYNLPADFGQMRKVEREITPGTLLYSDMPVTTIDDKAAYVGLPGKWFIFNSQLWLVPVPDQVVNLRYFYFKIPPALAANGDIPVLPVEYHRAIVWYALAQAKRRADDPAFSTYQTDYDNVKALMTQELFHRHQQNSYPVVRDDWANTR